MKTVWDVAEHVEVVPMGTKVGTPIDTSANGFPAQKSP